MMPADTPTSRKVFLNGLNREEQLGTLYDMAMAARNDQATDRKEHIEIRKDLTFIKGEIAGISRRKSLTTSENIRREIDKRNFLWIWYRDHVLPSTLAAIQTIIILYILYSAFGGKTP